VSGDDHRASLFRQLLHDTQYFPNQFRIEGRGWFVKKQDVRFHGKGPCNGGALLLPARKL
jgi:hypothetical protein